MLYKTDAIVVLMLSLMFIVSGAVGYLSYRSGYEMGKEAKCLKPFYCLYCSGSVSERPVVE